MKVHEDLKKNMKVVLSKELGELVALKGTHFKSFHANIESGRCYEMSSFGESKAEKFVRNKKDLREWIVSNARELSRIYPAGARVDSSNYNPVGSWSAG